MSHCVRWDQQCERLRDQCGARSTWRADGGGRGRAGDRRHHPPGHPGLAAGDDHGDRGSAAGDRGRCPRRSSAPEQSYDCKVAGSHIDLEGGMMPKSFPDHERAAIDRALRQAADASLRRSGVRGTTVDQLVAAAGISKGAFYTFYRSREALLWEVVKEEERRLIDAIVAIASGPGPIEDRLRAAFQEH